MTLSDTERFFYDHAGYVHNPNAETEDEARARCAADLARAEGRLKAGPYYIDVTPDPDPYDGDVPWGGPMWNVGLYSVADDTRPVLIGSLGAVACGEGDPYLRVVAAELALEYLSPKGGECPNPWHDSAPARRLQTCPECHK